MLPTTARRIVFAALLCIAFTACGTFRKLKKEVGVLDDDYRLTGKVANISGDPSRVYIGVWKTTADAGGDVEIVDLVSPNAEGLFAMFLPPGHSIIFSPPRMPTETRRGMRAKRYGSTASPAPLELSGGESLFLDVTLSPEVDAAALPRGALKKARAGRHLVELSSGEQVKVVLGEIADFDSPEFSAEMEHQGLWNRQHF